MNKKNLSVVLAGAMLATTVAPVLAETTASKEYTTEDLALLRNQIKAKMETKKISNYDAIKALAESKVADLMEKNKSAFGFKVVGKDGKDIDLTTLGGTVGNLYTTAESKVGNNVSYDINEVSKVLSDNNASKLIDCTIQIVERKTTEFKGQIVPGTEITKKADSESEYEPRADFIVADGENVETNVLNKSKGIAKDFEDAKKAGNKYISSIEGVGKKFDISTGLENDKATATPSNDYFKEVKLTTTVPNNIADAEEGSVEIYLDSSKKKVDLSLPLNDKGELLDCKTTIGMNEFAGFETAGTWKTSLLINEEPLNVDSYKISALDSNENLFKVEDLYDGITLTAKGTELAVDLENAYKDASSPKKELVKISAIPDNKKGDQSVYKFSVYYYKNETEAAKDGSSSDGDIVDGKDSKSNKVAYKSITIYSSNLAEIQALHNLLNPTVTEKTYRVGIVAGDNRYSTAVNVAKAQGIKPFGKTAIGNIVLVNGSSLVDGLSAAPLAAKKSAPVLLSKADKLPEETKEYIKDVLLKNKTEKADKKQVVVNLVGGNSVLSESLVAELEDMGLTVKRYGGANREATSLKVAEELKASNAAFVVGGNGEADAMAISSVAAKEKTPIIVSSVNGLSKKALTYVNENLAKGDITIVGGTSVVSEEDEKALNDSLSLNKASRIAGDNRFKTNAAIIKKYYTKTGANVNGIVLAKDGVAKKSELVDALAAANYAVANNAPIVLATSSLNASQKNELLKVNKASTFATQAKLVQVGQGVERSVLEELAKLFGLSNF